MKILFVSSGNSNSRISPIIKNQADSLEKQGIKIEHFLIKGKGITGYLKNIPFLKNKTKQNNYDLIHAHYVFAGILSFLSNIRIPLIVSYMGSDVYGVINKKGKTKIKSLFHPILANILPFFTKKIIIKSKNLKKYLLFKKKLIILPNGVDFEKFRPLNKESCRKKLNLPINKKIILFLGNPSDPRKNINLLKKAIKKTNQKNILLITPYPFQNKDLIYYLNSVDLLAFTSFKEGSPNVIKEAMACNCPIVSTNSGDIKQTIQNTEGCYMSPFNSNDFAKKIILALQFNKKTKGKKDIMHLESTIIAKKIIKIYSNIIKNQQTNKIKKWK